jgi:hypothetical protein
MIDVAGVASAAQQVAEALMVDSCTIDRASDDPTNATRTTVYSGKCRVKAPTRAIADTPSPVGNMNDPHRFRVDIPVSATGVKFHDHVTVTASLNPSIVGSDGFIVDLFAQSAASAQRLWCEERLR